MLRYTRCFSVCLLRLFKLLGLAWALCNVFLSYLYRKRCQCAESLVFFLKDKVAFGAKPLVLLWLSFFALSAHGNIVQMRLSGGCGVRGSGESEVLLVGIVRKCVFGLLLLWLEFTAKEHATTTKTRTFNAPNRSSSAISATERTRPTIAWIRVRIHTTPNSPLLENVLHLNACGVVTTIIM